MELDNKGHPIWDTYIKFPTQENIPKEEFEHHQLLISEVDLEMEASMMLQARKSQYLQSQNPVYLIEALLIAHRADLFPPRWVLDFLYSKLNQFHEGNGENNLNVLLEFNRGQGKNTAFQEVILKDRDDLLMMEIWKLKTFTGLSLNKIAKLVATRFNQDNLNTKIIKNTISYSTLESIYKKGKWESKFNEWFKVYNPFEKWTKVKIDHYLGKFGLPSSNPATKLKKNSIEHKLMCQPWV